MTAGEVVKFVKFVKFVKHLQWTHFLTFTLRERGDRTFSNSVRDRRFEDICLSWRCDIPFVKGYRP